jgi:hypothetical protein
MRVRRRSLRKHKQKLFTLLLEQDLRNFNRNFAPAPAAIRLKLASPEALFLFLN